jgi:hypothetical protein
MGTVLSKKYEEFIHCYDSRAELIALPNSIAFLLCIVGGPLLWAKGLKTSTIINLRLRFHQALPTGCQWMVCICSSVVMYAAQRAPSEVEQSPTLERCKKF